MIRLETKHNFLDFITKKDFYNHLETCDLEPFYWNKFTKEKFDDFIDEYCTDTEIDLKNKYLEAVKDKKFPLWICEDFNYHLGEDQITVFEEEKEFNNWLFKAAFYDDDSARVIIYEEIHSMR